MSEDTATDQVQASAEDLAAFSSGFSDTDTGNTAQAAPAVSRVDEHQNEEASGSDAAAPGADAAAEPAPPEFVQITRAEWDRMQNQQAELVAELGRVRDQTTGQIGGLQRVLTQAQAEAVVTGDDFAALRAIGLDEIADAMATDLGGVLKKTPRVVHADGGGAAVDPDAVARRVMFDIGLKGLRRAHPDFEQVRDSAEFQAFLAAKPEAYRDEFNTTLDADVASDAFSEFKAARKKATPAASAAAASATSMRRSRFAAAETPRGSPAQPQRAQTEIEAFNEGFATG